MSPLLPSRPLLFATLWILAPLTALAAPEELMEPETLSLSREEISDEALRGVIGIALVISELDPAQQPAGELPRFVPSGGTFQPAGRVALKDLRSISERSSLSLTARRFPVVGRRGGYLHVVIDASTNERAWLRPTPRGSPLPGIEFLSFNDSKAWEWSSVELFSLAPQGQTRLYAAPKPGARFHSLSERYPSRLRGEIVSTVTFMRKQGNFVQIGALMGLDDEPVPLGWVPLTDESGLLLLWPMAAQIC